jgi:hypothetical protein
LWTVVPGLLACLVERAGPSAAERRGVWCGIVVLLSCWGVGQAGFLARLGQQHPLIPLAAELQARKVSWAVAEPYDAHLLSFLTQQRMQFAEFRPFWLRLAHHSERRVTAGPVPYIVQATNRDWEREWKWPGPTPGETKRRLWPALCRWSQSHPSEVLSREPLVDGFELWWLAHPLPKK